MPAAAVSQSLTRTVGVGEAIETSAWRRQARGSAEKGEVPLNNAADEAGQEWSLAADLRVGQTLELTLAR